MLCASRFKLMYLIQNMSPRHPDRVDVVAPYNPTVRTRVRSEQLRMQAVARHTSPRASSSLAMPALHWPSGLIAVGAYSERALGHVRPAA